jgi:hypothetical protein
MDTTRILVCAVILTKYELGCHLDHCHNSQQDIWIMPIVTLRWDCLCSHSPKLSLLNILFSFTKNCIIMTRINLYSDERSVNLSQVMSGNYCSHSLWSKRLIARFPPSLQPPLLRILFNVFIILFWLPSYTFRGVYEGVSKSFQSGCLEQEPHMVLLYATRCICIALLWVSLVSFATITLHVASQWVFIFGSV